MSLTQDAAADQRWAAAKGIADGVMDQRMPRRRRIVWSWTVGLILGSWILGFALAAFLPQGGLGSDSGIDEDALWGRLIAGFVFQGLSVVLIVGGLIWAIRTKRFVTRWKSVASPLNFGERKWVGKTIRKAVDVEDAQKRHVVLAMASQNLRVIQALVPLYAGMTLLVLSLAISSPIALVVWLEVIGLALYALLFALLLREYRRSSSYLERFGGSQDASGV